MNLYLLRHGETDWNREGRLQGRTDIPLNQTGREQVRRAAEVLAARSPHIDLIFTSPLARARESAGIVAERLAQTGDVPASAEWTSAAGGAANGAERPAPNADVPIGSGRAPADVPECALPRAAILTEPLLTERSYGAGEGTTPAERAARFPDGVYPGMESQEALLQRGAAAFQKILDAAEGRQNILVAAHGSILRGILTAVTAGTPAARQWEIFGNGSIHLIRWAGGLTGVETVYAGTPTEAFRSDNGSL